MAWYVKCIPNAYVQSIEEIPYKTLKEQGYTTLFFDLDNTIIGYDEQRVSDSHHALFKRLAQDFKLVIISNSHYKRVYEAVKDLNLPFVWHAKKPLKFGFKKALKLVSSSTDKTVLIGDQLMTDVLGGNRMRFYTVLVRSVKRSSDRKITQFNRKLEQHVLRSIQKNKPELYQERLYDYVNDHDI